MMPVAVGLGSNVGDRERHLHEATARLSTVMSDLRVSSFHDTEAVGVGAQPPYLNAAAVGKTPLTARALLAELLAIERALGRERPYWGAPRTIDLDLLLYGEAVIEEPGLVVPHPRFRERRFVLAPLAEIAREWIDPVTGRTVGALLAALAVSAPPS